jgi:hypothetical protein
MQNKPWISFSKECSDLAYVEFPNDIKKQFIYTKDKIYLTNLSEKQKATFHKVSFTDMKFTYKGSPTCTLGTSWDTQPELEVCDDKSISQEIKTMVEDCLKEMLQK